MGKLYRTLGPVGTPREDTDPVPKSYVDNIDPKSLTYLRLGEQEILATGNPTTYPGTADIGLGSIYDGSSNIFSRAPFPLKIVRMGLSLQSFILANYSLGLTAPYVMNLIRFNASGSDPPFVVIGTATLPVGSRNLDADVDINLGVLAADVYSWSFATTGTSTDIGSINLIPWYEFREITTEQYEAEQETQQERIEQLNEELKTQEWYKLKMKELKNQLKESKTNATKRPSNT